MFLDHVLVGFHEGVVDVPVVVKYAEVAIGVQNPREFSDRWVTIEPVKGLSHCDEVDASVFETCTFSSSRNAHETGKRSQCLLGIGPHLIIGLDTVNSVAALQK